MSASKQVNADLEVLALPDHLAGFPEQPSGETVTSVDFEDFVRAERSKLIWFLMSYGASVHEAEEAAQASLIEAWRKWETIISPRLIRVLARRDEVPAGLAGLVQGLVREHGLYPYLRDIHELPLADRLAVEMHRPSPALSEDLVFHSQQAMVYERLIAGDNVVLSAPTSFGKSLIIDPVLAEREFRNAAIIVPTIALMNECRRRLSRLRHMYKIITHGSQRLARRNLFVMTPERLLEVRDLPSVDFFAIDEFYKLDPQHCERAAPLNILFRQLLSTGGQFYLLRPNVTALEGTTSSRLSATFISTNFTTVVTEMDRVNVPDEQLPDTLADECRRVGPETLIFCRSPKRTRDVAHWLLDRGIGGGRDLADAADWIAETYHPQWTVARALRRGIGIHHARLPAPWGTTWSGSSMKDGCPICSSPAP